MTSGACLPHGPCAPPNQVLSSLAPHSLVRADGQRHVLTDAGLRCLARRDRADVRPVVGRWSARKRRRRNAKASVYAGTALRATASQMEHHDAIAGFAAALSAETARSFDYEVVDLMPHFQLCRRLSLGLDQLHSVSRRLVPSGVPGSVALLPAGVRATGHHSQAGAHPPGEAIGVTSEAAGPIETTEGCRHWCCLCSRTLTPRTTSCELLGAQTARSCSPLTSRPSTRVGYWATHGNCRRLTLPEGGPGPTGLSCPLTFYITSYNICRRK